jgi:hypothetical protein
MTYMNLKDIGVLEDAELLCLLLFLMNQHTDLLIFCKNSLKNTNERMIYFRYCSPY